IVKIVDQQTPAALTLLEKVVNMNSGTMNFEGVQAVGEVMMQAFDEVGFETEWIPGEEFNRAGHVVARYKGERAVKKLLLIGHLDTVFEPDSPFQTYNMMNDTLAGGPGIADMKGGNIIMLEAVRALKQTDDLELLDVTVVMTGDEELSGRPLSLSKKALIDAAKYADVALGFENGDGKWQTANVARRGSIGWTLTVTGKPAHSSQVFREDIGAGAIYEAARILTDFYEELRSEEFLTFNPGRILGGTQVEDDAYTNTGTAFGKSNIVAEKAIVTGDIRGISIEQVERVKQKMEEIVSRNYPHTSATIEFSEGYPPMAPTEGNKELLVLYSEVSEDLGFGKVEAVNPLRAGAADVSFTAEYVEMALDGLGMSGTEGHTIREKGYLNSLPLQIKRAAILMLRLANPEQ
ncbi:MAG TPA: peptidase M20, partial [Balneolaceae bacterium]|nr:peptidase M20 [Balneolaceae bacterium]